MGALPRPRHLLAHGCNPVLAILPPRPGCPRRTEVVSPPPFSRRSCKHLHAGVAPVAPPRRPSRSRCPPAPLSPSSTARSDVPFPTRQNLLVCIQQDPFNEGGAALAAPPSLTLSVWPFVLPWAGAPADTVRLAESTSVGSEGTQAYEHRIRISTKCDLVEQPMFAERDKFPKIKKREVLGVQFLLDNVTDLDRQIPFNYAS